MVRIRLKRMGRRHRPFYRINAVEKKTQRDGKIIEQLGWYDPLEKDESKAIELKPERIKYWLSVGAQPSDTMMDILAKNGLVDAEAWKAKRKSRIVRKVAAQEKAAAATAAAAAATEQADGAADEKSE
ncbi:MAG: 30S ribosomal protein S16 [Phycisphaeraceae bacterium]|nr:MAG: 30S ribosomal protein S16 [Phycisphaeraceae bacterium]